MQASLPMGGGWFLEKEVDGMQSSFLPTQNSACGELVSETVPTSFLILNSVGGELKIMPLVAMPRRPVDSGFVLSDPPTLPSPSVRPPSIL